jgi:hypothetical protein
MNLKKAFLDNWGHENEDFYPKTTPKHHNFHQQNIKDNLVNQSDLQKILDDVFSTSEIDSNAKAALIKTITLRVGQYTDLTNLKAKLAVLYEYEKNYLELIKTYKEEIKFAGSLQEDLRKERAKFFSETLKEVSSALESSQVDTNVASIWLKELVDSYTKSLDLSSGLIEENTLDMIGKIRREAKSEAKQVSIDNTGNSPTR